MNLSRRGFILGAGATLVAAPAIVRAASLMKVTDRSEALTLRHLRLVLDELERSRIEPLPDGSYVAYLTPREFASNGFRIPFACQWQGVRFVQRVPTPT